MFGEIYTTIYQEKASNLHLQFGAGYLQHRFRIETSRQVVPQIETNYRKGYDRYTTGINTSQFVGYAFLPEEGFYQFFAGIYAQQGYTYNRRTINFDQPDVPISKDLRLDLQFGIRLGWYIPFTKQNQEIIILNNVLSGYYLYLLFRNFSFFKIRK